MRRVQFSLELHALAALLDEHRMNDGCALRNRLAIMRRDGILDSVSLQLIYLVCIRYYARARIEYIDGA